MVGASVSKIAYVTIKKVFVVQNRGEFIKEIFGLVYLAATILHVMNIEVEFIGSERAEEKMFLCSEKMNASTRVKRK